MQARYVLAALASLAYIGGSQWLMTHAPTAPWTAFALLAPMLAGVAAWTWRSRRRWAALALAGAIIYLLMRAVRGGASSPEGLYLAQHALIHVGLAGWFGASLRPGAQPVISALASRVHRQMTPDMWRYTRHVTLAWTLYFVLMALLSITLFHGASFDTWALFANVLTPVALTTMFGGEYLLRYQLHPEFERVSMMDAIRAYMQISPPTAVPPRDSAPPLR